MTQAVKIVPSEDMEQRNLVEWLHKSLPEVRFFAIPNGGWRSKATAGKLKAAGVKPGVPDMFIATARPPYHGLFIEMKREKGGQLSPYQKIWLANLRAGGYRAEVCAGAEAAKAVITDYLASGDAE
jgi:rhodanese-related sulfurtransferase